MDNTMPPPSKQPKRFFDVLPPSQSRPSATSRPVIARSEPHHVDTMLHSGPVGLTSPPPSEELTLVNSETEAPIGESAEAEVAEPQDATTMMQQEYDEVAHELPAGDTEDAQELVPVAERAPLELPMQDLNNDVVVVHHESSSHESYKVLIMVAFLIMGLAVVMLDILLDTHVIRSSLPHTHFFHK